MDNDNLYQAAWHLFTQSNVMNATAGEPADKAFFECKFSTALPGVRMFYQTQVRQKEAGVYTPALVYIFSGAKHGELGRWQFTYDADNYLLLTSTYPLQCKVDASTEVPLLGIQIDLDRTMVRQLLHDIGETKVGNANPADKGARRSGIECCPVSPSVRRHIGELLLTLHSPVEARLFGNERVRAVVYALLQSEGLAPLQHWGQMDGQFAHFQKAVAYVQANYQRAIDINMMAEHSGLSAATLNRVFRRYASDSPVQYLKKVRLNLARNQIIQSGASVQTAAYNVGYESASQFSREFKRYFGYPPKQSRAA